MKTFEVYTTFEQCGKYIVKAKSEKEARKKFWEGDWQSFNEDNNLLIDNHEEITEIIEIIDKRK